MKYHLSEDELTLHIYGENDDPERVRGHLEECRSCLSELEELRRILADVSTYAVPQRDDGYSERVWRELAGRLDLESGAERSGWRISPRASLALAAAVLLAVFLAGRFSAHWGSSEGTAEIGEEAPVGERILLVAVGKHLERSEMLLTELANGAPAAVVDLSLERRRAQDLVGENRLFRQSASQVGEAGLVEVLDSLERLLLDVAHSSKEVGPDGLAALQDRIESQGLLFKVKIIHTQVRERQRSEVHRF